MADYVLFNEKNKEYFSSLRFNNDSTFDLVFNKEKKLAWRYESMDETLKEVDHLMSHKRAGNNVRDGFENIKVIFSPWYETVVERIINIIKDTHGVTYEYKMSQNCDGFFGFYHPFHDKHHIEFSKDYVTYGSPMLLPYRMDEKFEQM